MKTVKTPAGTVLPLTNLKGKDYLMVAYRLQWFNETEHSFEIDTNFLLLTDEQTVARANVKVLDKATGKLIKQASATKRETKKDFPDHTEKAETSAVGRALAMLGYGTQFAVSDLDEGTRLADSPVVAVNQSSETIPEAKTTTVASFKKNTFKKPTSNAILTPDEVTRATGISGSDGEWQ